MGPHVDVDAVALRAARYWMEDGLVEISFGLFFALQAGVFLALRMPPAWLAAGGTLGIAWGFRKLKERITFPRCGYIAFPVPNRIFLALLLPLAAALTLYKVIRGEEWLAQIAIMAFVMVFAPLFPQNPDYQCPGTRWAAFLHLLLAAFIGGYGFLREFKSADVWIAVMGMSVAIIGVLRFWGFLKANPKPQETEA